MKTYYREPNGDYLVVWPMLRRKDDSGQVIFDGRATALAGLVCSMCSTGVGERFLATCGRVRRSQVPRAWLNAIG